MKAKQRTPSLLQNTDLPHFSYSSDFAIFILLRNAIQEEEEEEEQNLINGDAPSWLVLYSHRSPLFVISSSPSLPISSPITFSHFFFNRRSFTRTSSTSCQMEARMIMAIAVAGFCSALLITVFFSLLWLWIRRQRRTAGKSKSKDAEKGIGLASFVIGKKGCVSVIDFKVLEKATGNFEESNVLGEGGFGKVYKALLDDNLAVAVKKIDCRGSQADIEFENEVNILSRIHHPNIICQLGCSSEGDAKLIVYELMENGSLETLLHGPSRGSALNWHMRMKIALDVARGLEYLHEHCQPSIIHRDLKTSNILLDANFNAKLSDFGIAITDGTQNKNKMKVSGTLGYVAPEYLSHGKLTEKSDVYAFGIVALELLLGRRPMEKLPTPQSQSFIRWAMPRLTDRSQLPNIVDPVIRNTMDLKHLYQVAAMAVLCVQDEASYRPLIKDVLHSLVPLVPIELGGTLRFNPSPQ